MKRLVVSLAAVCALVLPATALADGQKPKPNENAAIHSMCSSQHQYDYYKTAFLGAVHSYMAIGDYDSAATWFWWYYVLVTNCTTFNPDLV